MIETLLGCAVLALVPIGPVLLLLYVCEVRWAVRIVERALLGLFAVAGVLLILWLFAMAPIVMGVVAFLVWLVWSTTVPPKGFRQ